MNESTTTMATFVHAIPGSNDRYEALKALVGLSLRHNNWEYSGQKKRLALQGVLKQFGTEPWRPDLVLQLMSFWAERFTGGLRDAMGLASPMDRFEMQLGLVATPSEGEKISADTSTTPSRITDRGARVATAIQFGHDACLDDETIFRMVAQAYIKRIGEAERQTALTWFDNNRRDYPVDDLIATIAGQELHSMTYATNHPPEAIAIEWASRISDPELRKQMARGAFRLLMSRRDDAAGKYLQRATAPADLLPEFQAIYQENR